jgi:hypothetical protein
MQGYAYPAWNEPPTFSTTMVGILDDDAIEVPILHRPYHTATMIDPGHAVYNAHGTRMARAPSISTSGPRFPLG